MDRPDGLRRPRWTLERGPSQASRPPEALTAAPGDVQRVVAAVHHACETLTQITAADQEQIHAAAGAGRLLVPTRSLPESSDIPRPFAEAPGDRVDEVLGSYRDAGTASTRATTAVAEIAAAIRAPSQLLTAARAAIHAGAGLNATERPPTAEPARVRRWTRNITGPVERTLQDLGVTSPPVLLRAAAIDKAGEQIILNNGPETSPAASAPLPLT